MYVNALMSVEKKSRENKRAKWSFFALIQLLIDAPHLSFALIAWFWKKTFHIEKLKTHNRWRKERETETRWQIQICTLCWSIAKRIVACTNKIKQKSTCQIGKKYLTTEMFFHLYFMLSIEVDTFLAIKKYVNSLRSWKNKWNSKVSAVADYVLHSQNSNLRKQKFQEKKLRDLSHRDHKQSIKITCIYSVPSNIFNGVNFTRMCLHALRREPASVPAS